MLPKAQLFGNSTKPHYLRSSSYVFGYLDCAFRHMVYICGGQGCVTAEARFYPHILPRAICLLTEVIFFKTYLFDNPPSVQMHLKGVV